MALLTSELQRIKAELGYNVLTAGAEPFINVVAIFEQVVAAYMTAGAVTTSATAVTAATTPTPATLTLGSGTGFATFARVVVDVDDRQEIATAQNVSGTSLTLLLTKAHTGTYPVTVEGGESIVRGYLQQLQSVGTSLGDSYDTAGIKKVDVIEFYGGGSGSVSSGITKRSELISLQSHLRDELASILGVPNAWRRHGACNALSVY